MHRLKYFIPFLFFTLSSCSYLDKKPKTQASNEKLVFVGDVQSLNPDQARKITNQISRQVKNLNKMCRKKSSLKNVQKLSSQLQQLGKYANATYKTNKFFLYKVNTSYTFDKRDKENGTTTIELGHHLLTIGSVLKDRYAMKYKSITSSPTKTEACKNLKDNYLFSYGIYYNLRDNTNIEKEMSPFFKYINKSISCICSK